jgi:hypothetical protein
MITNDVSDYINLLVRIHYTICNHPLCFCADYENIPSPTIRDVGGKNTKMCNSSRLFGLERESSKLAAIGYYNAICVTLPLFMKLSSRALIALKSATS